MGVRGEHTHDGLRTAWDVWWSGGLEGEVRMGRQWSSGCSTHAPGYKSLSKKAQHRGLCGFSFQVFVHLFSFINASVRALDTCGPCSAGPHLPCLLPVKEKEEAPPAHPALLWSVSLMYKKPSGSRNKEISQNVGGQNQKYIGGSGAWMANSFGS